MNLFGKLREYIIGEYLAETDNLFVRARIQLIYTLSLFTFCMVIPFEIVMLYLGFKIHFLINLIPVLMVLYIFFGLKKKRSIAFLGGFYAFVQIFNTILHSAVQNFQVSMQATLWLLVGVIVAFFTVGRKSGIVAGIILIAYQLFSIINTRCSFCYFNPDLGNKENMPENSPIVLFPLVFILYMIWLFVKTTFVAEQKIQDSSKRNEDLLLNILPTEVAEELKEKGTANAKHFDDVTVLFTDFKGFATLSQRLNPQQLVDELHACFSAFDAIVTRHNIEKIKTVGDAYLAVSGLPLANASHAADMLNAAIEIREFMLNRRKELGEKTFEIRIGIHSGSVVAGIVGVKKFAYDIWGDTVNTAARMEQNSEAGKINISQTTYELVKDKFNCEYRGEIEAKNKGLLKMYFCSPL